jgi:hypothetical protein
MKPRRILLLFFPLLFTGILGAQERMAIKGLLEWDKMELGAAVTLDLEQAGIRLPAGRARAEALLEYEFPSLVQPFINNIQVDSSSTLSDMVDRGELTLHRMDSFAEDARRIPPAISADLSSISARYTISLKSIGAEFVRHSRPLSITTPLAPSPTRSYTGIIIIADESLPVHGRTNSALAVPCLFPKIWDSEMNLVFERNMIDPRSGQEGGLVAYVSRDSIMKATPSALDEALIARVGDNPLQIMARSIFGVAPTDPVIDKDDALLILSSEANRNLLREGRVAIVIAKEGLKKNIP